MESPTRILYICHDGDLYGSQQSLNLIVKHLPKDAYRCVVSIARPGPLRQLLAGHPGVTVLSHRRLQWVKHDRRNGWQRLGDVLNLMVNAFPRTFQLLKMIQREKIRMVHTNSVVSPEGALAAALSGIPHVWHIRELFMEKSPKFHMVLGCRISRWFIDRFSDQVICISEAVARQFGEYREADPGKYTVIHNALEFEHTQPLPSLNDAQRMIMRSLSLKALNLPEDKVFRIGYIGRLSAGKGFHELLEAFTLLRRQGVQAELIVAGNFVDNAYEQRILKTIEDEHLGDAVRMLGYQTDLAPLYEVLDVLVVPSVNEPFGRVVIEAMANGVPCVAADAGGIPEIITPGEDGLLYPPGDVHALAGMLQELSVTFWKLDAIRQNARRMVCQRFNIETQIDELNACYQSVIRHHLL